MGGLLYGEYDASGSLVREYVYLNGEPIAQIDNVSSSDVLTYLHTDHLGTPRVASNTSGASVWSWDSDAFGNGAPTGSQTVNLRFAGQYYDDESGLHYNWNRYYDPETGRYISSDPIGLSGGLNTFAYVSANPVMFTDPEGLKSVMCAPGDDLCRMGIHGGNIGGGGGGGVIPASILIRAVCGGIAKSISDIFWPPVINNDAQGEPKTGEEGGEKKGKRNIKIQHKNRKEAKEAAKHAHKGKPRPEPPKKSDPKKKKAYKEQKKYANPERHRGSDHPEPHYHDSNKSGQPINRHHVFPAR